MSLETLTDQSFSKKGSAPGKAVVLKTESGGGDVKQERTVELYHPPGISSGPTPQDRVVIAPAGTGVRVAIGTHNYRIEVEPLSGETIIYSTNSDGSVVKATIKLDTDGNIEVNGNSKRFVTYKELDTALQTFKTALNLHVHPTAATGPPSPPTTPMSIDISAAETTTVKTGG